MYLEAAGFVVAVSERGDTAWSTRWRPSARHHRLDSCFRIDGLEITRRLRSAGTTPIIMLTARDDAVDRSSASSSAPTTYITNPSTRGSGGARARGAGAPRHPRAPGRRSAHPVTIEAETCASRWARREVFVGTTRSR